MKTLLAILLLGVLVIRAAATELVLSTSSKSGGVTITVTVGRVQGEPAADGTITLQIIPREVVKAADGTVLSDKFLGAWMTVQLDGATVAAINASIVQEKTATDAARAAAADGSITLQIIPREVVKADAGTVLSDKFLAGLMTVQLDPGAAEAAIKAIIK